MLAVACLAASLWKSSVAVPLGEPTREASAVTWTVAEALGASVPPVGVSDSHGTSPPCSASDHVRLPVPRFETVSDWVCCWLGTRLKVSDAGDTDNRPVCRAKSRVAACPWATDTADEAVS